MTADLTIYCIQEVTDYAGFERLCHDLMSVVGYAKIEPLGGFKDKGRDAIHVSLTNAVTIFAYSVRDDWRAKLAEDAAKIHRHGHSCNCLVFITSAAVTAGERDEAISSIKQQYGWTLDLYSVERLRNLLDIQFPNIKAAHPEIFPPEFLAIQQHIRQIASRDHIFVSYAPEDLALAAWLSRKLTAEGYLVWCERLKVIGGEDYPTDIDDALHSRVCHMIALYSQKSLGNPELTHHRAVAIGMNKQKPNFMIPLRIENIPVESLDQVSRQLVFVPFETNWAEGLQTLLEKLRALNCPKPLPNGRSVAAGAYFERNILSEERETLVSNCFSVDRLPNAILRYSPKQTIPPEVLDAIKMRWAFRAVTDKLFLSFHRPPREVVASCELRELSSGPWKTSNRLEGINTKNLISELIRKSLFVKCIQKGLQFCPTTKLCYFPYNLASGDKIKYLWPNGKTSSINVVGERKYNNAERYRYHLAADYYVSQDLIEEFSVLLRVRVRITDLEGIPLPSRRANSRRKHLCKNWWNGEWLSRMLAITQHLSDGENIVIGDEPVQQIVITSNPVSVVAPRGIDETALDEASYEREDILSSFEDENGEDGASPSQPEDEE